MAELWFDRDNAMWVIPLLILAGMLISVSCSLQRHESGEAAPQAVTIAAGHWMRFERPAGAQPLPESSSFMIFTAMAGRIDAEGVYIAPSTPGTDTVRRIWWDGRRLRTDLTAVEVVAEHE